MNTTDGHRAHHHWPGSALRISIVVTLWAALLLIACSDDEVTNPPDDPLTLTAADPAFALVGSGDLELRLRGTGFDEGAVAGWDGAERITSVVSPTELVVTISAFDLRSPADIEIWVVSGDGDTNPEVSNPLLFPIRHSVGPPQLKSVVPDFFYPSEGVAKIQLLGSGFDATSVVQWNDDPRETSFLSTSEIVAILEPGDVAALGTARVTVLTPGEAGGTSSPFVVHINPEPANPVLVELRPTSFLVDTTSPVLTVLGYGFMERSAVRWNGVELPTEFVSSNELRAVPAASDLAEAGEAEITVRSIGMLSNARTIRVDPVLPPVLESVTPNFVDVLAEGATLSIEGTQFTEETVVLWDGAPLPALYLSSERLVVTLGREDMGEIGSAQLRLRTRDLGSETVIEVIRYADPNLEAHDIVSDSERGLLYVAVPSHAADGNHVVALDAGTGSRIFQVFVGSNPTLLEASSDGGYLYVALEGAPRMVRIDLETRQVDQDFDLGRDGETPFFAMDIAVSPVDPDLVAVVIEHPKRTPSYNGTGLYRDGLSLDYWDERLIDFYFAEFTEDGTSLLGVSIGDERVYRLDVSDESLDYVEAIPALDDRAVYGFKILEGRVYGSNGEVLAVGDLSRIGTCSVSGYVLPEPRDGRIVYLSNADNEPKLSVFDADTFQPIAELWLPWDDSGSFRRDFGSLVAAGPGRVAFRAHDRLVLLPTPLPADGRGGTR